MQILSELFVEDISALGDNGDEENFLRQCYSQSGALSQYASVSKDILRARYANLFQDATESSDFQPATTKKGVNPELLAQGLSRRPILLVGDRGVGKTMFIKHLYKVEAKEVFENTLVFYIDFGSKPALTNELNSFVIEEIRSQLFGTYGIDIEEMDFVDDTLRSELTRFDKGIYGPLRSASLDLFSMKRLEFIEEKLKNKENYLRVALDRISKTRRKQIVIFLDNVDQRPDEFQEDVFLIGQTMAATWPVATYVSIRPETFYRSKVSGTLSAYHPRVFTISPPRVDLVVNKRLSYGISLLEEGIQLGLGEDFSVRSDSLSDYLQVLVYSFTASKWLIEFLDNMCGGNIRLALEFIMAFVGSGHLDTQKILNIYRESGSYLIPLHEFLRSIIYVDHEFYDPSESEILNLFDICTPDGREHFLAPILLSQMGSWSLDSTADGFVSSTEIYSYMQGLGFTPHQVNWSLYRLIRRNLLESPSKSRGNEESDLTTHYRITSVGSYYSKRLIAKFSYIDAMIVDTPIVDSGESSKIREVVALHHRLDRARLFCNYLTSQWHSLADLHLAFDWPSVNRLIDRDINYITGKISIREDVEESPTMPTIVAS